MDIDFEPYLNLFKKGDKFWNLATKNLKDEEYEKLVQIYIASEKITWNNLTSDVQFNHFQDKPLACHFVSDILNSLMLFKSTDKYTEADQHQDGDTQVVLRAHVARQVQPELAGHLPDVRGLLPRVQRAAGAGPVAGGGGAQQVRHDGTLHQVKKSGEKSASKIPSPNVM